MKNYRRGLSLLLCLLMLLSLLPTAYAEDGIELAGDEPFSDSGIEEVVGDDALGVPENAAPTADETAEEDPSDTSVGADALIGPETSDNSAEDNATQEELEQMIAEGFSDTDTFEATLVDSGTCGDNVTWTLDDAGTLSISGTGEMESYDVNGHAPWGSYSKSINRIIIGTGITRTGKYCFRGLKQVTAISLPSTLAVIDSYTFSGCSGFSSITLPASVKNINLYAFNACSSLTGITIPSKVDIISEACFRNCSSLETVKIQGTVTKICSMAFDGCNALRSINLPEGLTTIAYNAFGSCYNLERITIPSTLTTFDGTSIFSGCSSLQSIVLPEGVSAIPNHCFSGCSNLTTIGLPKSLTEVGAKAFYKCDTLYDVYYTGTKSQWSAITLSSDNESLTNATLHCLYTINILDIENGSVVAYVDGEASDVCFDGKTVTLTVMPADKYKLESISYNDGSTHALSPVEGVYSFTMPAQNVTVNASFYSEVLDSGTCGDNLTWTLYEDGELVISGTGAMVDYGEGTASWYKHRLKINAVNVKSGVTSVGSYAFYGCIKLADVNISQGVTSIGNHAFESCTKLSSVTIPDGVTSIDWYVFSNCSSLTSVTIPDSVTSIGDYAFSRCSGLTSVTIPDSVTTIREYAFSGCSSLTSVTIPEGVTIIDWFVFSECSSLTSVTIPESVTNIGAYAFRGCSSLTSVTIPDSVTSIYWFAFYDCRSLTSVSIPDSVTSIGNGTFDGCSSLTSVSIPDSVTSIGQMAFFGCGSLTSVTIPDGVASIGEDAFFACGSLKDVYFGGTKEEWDAITVGGGNTSLTNATIHYESSPVITYTVTFDANGGSGAPGAQAKTQGVNLTLSSAKPTRASTSAGSYTVTLNANGGSVSPASLTANRTTSYTFKNWNTTANGGGTSYNPGATYSTDASVTLYAQWDSITTTQEIELPTPIREGYIFKGWATSSTAASGVTGSYTPEANETLYAIWESLADAPRFTVSSATARPGETVTLTVAVENNPGLASFELEPVYDSTALTWTGVTQGELPGNWDTALGEAITWIDADNYGEDGAVFTLDFQVPDSTTDGNYTVSLRYDPDNVFDENGSNVSVAVIPGKVTVSSRTPGDVNGDDKVNNKDVLWLMRFLKGREVTVVPGSTDINGDGKNNNKDVLWLMRYIKYQNVEIH